MNRGAGGAVRARARVAVLLIAVALSAVGCSQRADPTVAPTRNADPVAEVTVARDIPYREIDGETLAVDVCLPAAPTGADPAIMLLHGGGFTQGSRADEGIQNLCVWFAEQGYIGIPVSYRLGEDEIFPAQLEDVQAAAAWLREPAQTTAYGIDPARIGVLGSSAGAILAMSAGTFGEGALTAGSRVGAVVSLSGVSAMSADAIDLGEPHAGGGEPDPRLPRVSFRHRLPAGRGCLAHRPRRRERLAGPAVRVGHRDRPLSAVRGPRRRADRSRRVRRGDHRPGHGPRPAAAHRREPHPHPRVPHDESVAADHTHLGDTVEFRDIGRAVRRNLVLIFVILALSVGAAVAYSLIVRPTYEATTRVLFSVQSSGGIAEVVAGNQYLMQRVQTLVPLAETPLILQPVIDELGLETTSDELAPFVTVTVEGVGTTLSVVAGSSDPQSAVDLSTAVAASFSDQVTQLEANPAVTTTTITANVVQPAVAPTSPTTPNWPLNIAIGLAVGLVVAAGAVALRTATDPRVRDAADVATAVGGLTVVGAVPPSRRPRLDMLTAPSSPTAEAYRKLRSNVRHRIEGLPAVSLLVTSPAAGEGKTTVALNLALALAESGESVTVVDADLRGSRLADRLGLRASPGFADVLKGGATVADVIQPWGESGVRVLVAGPPTPNASELLGSPTVDSVLGSLSTRGGIVIVDSPAALPFADATVLGGKTSVVLIVARRGRTRKRSLSATHEALAAVGATVIGAALMNARGGGER